MHSRLKKKQHTVSYHSNFCAYLLQAVTAIYLEIDFKSALS